MEMRARVGTLLAAAVATTTAACSKGPPADLAPDPGLAARIESIRILTPPGGACPGGVIRASYVAVLRDGTEIPFSRDWDGDDPPLLHVIMLGRTSPEARPRKDGDWDADPDPLRSAIRGYRLSTFLRAKPSVNGSAVVAPDYSCVQHVMEFQGRPGGHGGAGADGPDVTVRLGVVASPFYERLLVAGIEVGVAPPFYVLADADKVPPADWLVLTSRGGRGGHGVPGQDGADGAGGSPGCPGSPGGTGGAGGNGGPGGEGGRGGRLTVVAPDHDPYLAGLVAAYSIGGPGGAGGDGGAGGKGGAGGAAEPGTDRRCSVGADGAAGPAGSDGARGPDGPPGAPMETITLPLYDVYGRRLPPVVQELIDYTQHP